MDFHIDKKIGSLLAVAFVLGGIIGGLGGVALGHEGREFRDFRTRGGLPMIFGGRGNIDGIQGGFRSDRDFIRRDAPRGVSASAPEVQQVGTTTVQ